MKIKNFWILRTIMNYDENFRKVLLGEPHVILGKKGIYVEFTNHLMNLLKRYKIIKIKALKIVANKSNIKEIAKTVADATGSHLLDVRGLKFIISKHPIKK